ncbi:MAG TPA: hybrid sensor histidine kinase/response regulator [Steroidobacteraceae bacterium]|nr:hybrid sensor histidine kinase/response regulator [Steroidobacteraceae bacterium]
MSAILDLKVKCLIVDDLEENLFALSTLLRRDDVELLTARSGREALELLLVHDVALAFLDVQMPDMDGFELAELMRGAERTRHVPIIFVTAGSRDQHRFFKGYEIGAVDFLYKPIEPHILKNKAEIFFQLHRQKQQLAHELQQRTETLRFNEMFTAVLGHDLRNPLHAILTAAQVLQRYGETQMVKETAARMMSSGRWMSRMIEDMLDLARVRLGSGLQIDRQPTDLFALVQRVAHEHQTASPARRIEVQQQGTFMGEWDADRLAQVIGNLVGNALRHGKVEIPVQLHLDGTGVNAIVLRVANGGEIPADVLPHIFDPFRSGQSPSARSEGLGLGLYIVQQLVHAHEGTVAAESADGRTAFIVTVPRSATKTSE